VFVPVPGVGSVAVALVNEVGVVPVLDLLMAAALSVCVLVAAMHPMALSRALIPVPGVFGV
jgi:hypothetical protein